MSTMTLSPHESSLQTPLPADVVADALLDSVPCGHTNQRLPGATYRLQFNRSFTFRDARDIVPYLAALGITHVYASPYLKARAGSPHGYDILDHNSLNPEIGSEQDYDEFVRELHAHGMGQILDVVPNHMGVAACDNAWWTDVLEDGPSSPYASFFDIDWMPLKPDLAHNRLASLNEVGGDPDKFGISVAAFHQHNLDHRAQRPHSLLTTSTHDTKRGEDVRARINVLSEIPQEWKSHLFRWTRWNQRKKLTLDGELAPSRNDEYLLYQTLIGTWPFEPLTAEQRARHIDRIQQYMLKATREAKVHTSWISPNENYEQATRSFIAAILVENPKNAFLSDFEPFARRVADFGICNSLAQTLLKLTCPSVPDLYQGADLWDLRLVDPDNREPVDYFARREMLDSLQDSIIAARRNLAELACELFASRHDGRIKLYVLLKSLRLRHNNPDLFTTGEYIPLEVTGAKRDHLCGFARSHEETTVVVIVPRLCARLTALSGPPLGQYWEDTSLCLPTAIQHPQFRNLFTGEVVPGQAETDSNCMPIATVLNRIPIALLTTPAFVTREPNGTHRGPASIRVSDVGHQLQHKTQVV